MALLYQTRITYHKRRFLLFWVFLVSLRIHAIATDSIPDTLHHDTIRTFTEKILFPKASAIVSGQFAGNQAHIDSIRSFLSNSEGRNHLSVKIIGSYSPEGKYAFNAKLAKARASALADIVKEFNPSANPATSITHPAGWNVNFSQQRFAELQIVYQHCQSNAAKDDTVAPAANEISPENDLVSEAQPVDTIAEMRTEADDPFVAETKNDMALSRTGNTRGGRLFLTTNMLYDAALTPNIGVGISVTDRVTVLADWMYARWNNRDKKRYWRIYGGDIEARYRISRRMERSPLGGHHVGAYCSMARYDFQAGRNHRGILSDKFNYAAGMSYTYSMPISTRLNIDFSLGVGYLWGTYKRHRPIDDCDVWLSTHKLGWFGPTRAGVSLVWLLGKTYNDKKGGSDR